MDEPAATPAPAEPDHDPLADDAYNRYVHMVLYARKGAGTWSDDDELEQFTVYLGEPAVIRINDEPHGWSVARTRRSFTPGEEVAFTDLQSDQVAQPDHAPPYITARRTERGWRVDLEINTPHPAAPELLATGQEFLAIAEHAHAAGALRAFVENAFHAAESFARVELLSYPVVADELEGPRKHTHVQSVYDLWLRLGNTDSRFPALLRALANLRSPATYANKPFTLDAQSAAEHVRTLHDLADHARDVANSVKGRTINVIATRPIAEGTLVSSGDITIRPPKGSPDSRGG